MAHAKRGLAKLCAFKGFSDSGNSSIEPSRETVSPWNIRTTAYVASIGPMPPSFLNIQGRNVQRNLIAIKSLCGTRLTHGSVTMRCQPRFQTTYKSFPGLMVHRTRVFVPTF